MNELVVEVYLTIEADGSLTVDVPEDSPLIPLLEALDAG